MTMLLQHAAQKNTLSDVEGKAFKRVQNVYTYIDACNLKHETAMYHFCLKELVVT